jgi:hypothetical protein
MTQLLIKLIHLLILSSLLLLKSITSRTRVSIIFHVVFLGFQLLDSYLRVTIIRFTQNLKNRSGLFRFKLFFMYTLLHGIGTDLNMCLKWAIS